MPLLALIKPAVPAVRARGLARAAGDRRRQRLRCCACLSCACRPIVLCFTVVAQHSDAGCCWHQCWLLTAGLRWCKCMCIVDNFIVMLVTIVTQHSSLFMPGFIHKICGGEL